MRWRSHVVAVLGAVLLGGCEFLVTFETVPENAGGSGGGAGTTTTTTTMTGGAGGTTTGSTSSTSSEGGAACTAECCATADCPLPADPCVTVACTSGQCVQTPIPDGEAAAAQTPGDCKKLVCQGGAAMSVMDSNDVLDDMNECTMDTCSAGGPKSNTLNQDTACTTPGGEPGVCDGNGRCVECTSNAQCPVDRPKCEGNGVRYCVPFTCADGPKDGSETDKDCGGPDCAPCDSGRACLQGSDCVSGVCQGGVCQNATCTDAVKNGSEGDVDCGSVCPKKCAPGQRCNKGSDCTSNQCTGQGGVCVANCQDGLKDGTESDVDCGGGVCKDCGAGQACLGVGANCLSGKCGPDGNCEQGDVATPCAAAADCLSGHCVDGVCCSGACPGVCTSCNVAGSVGTCANIPAGQDPQSECLNACDGNGACAP